ncbi:MAG: hypothetical protein BWY19_00108 [bacterium ADurb.Bin212]|nr:MAG: hypothetical protein BWY19_00108 [bacterium ADurb.Bin212]
MTISEIFSKQYLFDPVPPSENSYLWYQLAFFSLLLIIGIIITLSKKIDKKIKSRQLYCYLTCGILGLVYLFSRYEQLPWLGSRLFLAVVLLVLLVWTTIITVWMTRYTKTLDKEKILSERYKKYLPKKKK